MNPVLTPALVSVVITSIIAPLAFFVLNRRAENRKRNFEVRFAEYKHYMKTLDEITSTVQNDFEKYFHETVAKSFKTIIDDNENSGAALIDLNSALTHIIASIQTSFSRAEGELHGLKLVCSDKLLKLVNEYVAVQRSILSELTKIIGNYKTIDINNPLANLSGDLKAKGELALRLYDQIQSQMRKELKIR